MTAPASRREYLLFEVGDGVRYINITDSLVSFNFTAIFIAPLVNGSIASGARGGICGSTLLMLLATFPPS